VYSTAFVVLYFYPKADAPGRTTQACGVRDHLTMTTWRWWALSQL
jgi:peroxiredoxin